MEAAPTKIQIWLVKPEVPVDPAEKKLLRESLKIIGLQSLLNMAWTLKSQTMIRELLGELPSPFPITMRARPAQWEEELVGAAFEVPTIGLPMLSKGDNRLSAYFTGWMDPKEGWLVEQGNNEELIRVL